MDPLVKRAYDYATMSSAIAKTIKGQTMTLNDLSDAIKTLFRGFFVKNASVVYDQLVNISGNDAVSAVIDRLRKAGLVQGDSNVLNNKDVSTRVAAIINEIFDRPIKYNDFFEAIDLGTLDVPAFIQDKIGLYIDQLANLETADLIRIRNELENISATYVNNLGQGDDVYNQIKGFGLNSTVVKPITSTRAEIISQIQSTIDSFNTLINQYRRSDQAIQNYVDFFIDQARANGIDLNDINSKMAVPVPFGATIEMIASRFLGDSERWMEIVAVNGLRSPYIDEEGFTRPILGTTAGSQILLSDIENLTPGKPVMIVSDTQPLVNAKIRSIQTISAIQHIVDLDKDVTGYSESTGATLKAYLPGTVNSNMMIYIPSSDAPKTLFNTIKISPEIDDQTIFAAIAESDILLTTEGDIAMLPSGDFQVSSGITNLLQAAKLRLVTPRGSLLQHPTYGFGVESGTPTSEIDRSLIQRSINEQYAQDLRFGNVLFSKVSKIGTGISIDVLLGLPSTDIALPVSVNLRG